MWFQDAAMRRQGWGASRSKDRARTTPGSGVSTCGGENRSPFPVPERTVLGGGEGDEVTQGQPWPLGALWLFPDKKAVKTVSRK